MVIGADYMTASGVRAIARLPAIVGCCARGALRIAHPSTNFYGEEWRDVTRGNDEPKSAGWTGSDLEDRGESLGWAFRCAMEEP